MDSLIELMTRDMEMTAEFEKLGEVDPATGIRCIPESQRAAFTDLLARREANSAAMKVLMEAKHGAG